MLRRGLLGLRRRGDDGSGSTFDPDRAPARQELAVALYRFAQSSELDTQPRADLSGYADADQVASWARAGDGVGGLLPACWRDTAPAVTMLLSPIGHRHPGGVLAPCCGPCASPYSLAVKLDNNM